MCEVKQPLCNAGCPNLDFGQGFYVTDLREQAVNWAQCQSVGRELRPQLNVYKLNIERVRSRCRCLHFEANPPERCTTKNLFLIEQRLQLHV
nr:DUF3990 domain-containing protein [Bacteroides intestinalis]